MAGELEGEHLPSLREGKGCPGAVGDHGPLEFARLSRMALSHEWRREQ